MGTRVVPGIKKGSFGPRGTLTSDTDGVVRPLVPEFEGSGRETLEDPMCVK